MSDRRRFVSSLVLIAALAATAARADRVQLVADIDPGPSVGSFSINELVTFQNAIFFQGCDDDGCELWKSDGVPGGVTTQVADINPGSAHSFPSQFTVIGTTLFFRATGPAGIELWKSDGTPGGTMQVKDINPGASGSNPNYLTGVSSASLVYFSANDGVNGTEIWKSDGTEGGTVMVKDISTSSSAPSGLMRFGSRVVFAASDASGREPWITDGTSGGTFRLADIWPGSGSSLSPVFAEPVFTSIGHDAFFVADDGTGLSLWTADGTTTGTVRIDGFASGGPYSRAMQIGASGGKVFVALASTETVSSLPVAATLWSYDSAGTSGNLNLRRFELSLDRQGPIGQFESYDNANGDGPLAYFAASTRNSGLELWKSNGTVDGTRQVGNIWYGAASAWVSPQATSLGLLLRARDPLAHLETWFSDGTSAGTVRLGDFYPGNTPGNTSNQTLPMPFATLGGRVYFGSRDGLGAALWRTNGTPAGTERVWVATTGAGNSVPLSPTPFGQKLLFSAVTTATGREPWITDGTPAGTLPLGDLAPGVESSAAEEFAVLGGIALFRAWTPATGWELFRTDGTFAGTALVADLVPGSGSSEPAELTAFGPHVYFRACVPPWGCELWRSDGTEAGTTLVVDLASSSPSSYPELLTPIAGKLLFRASLVSSGTELFATDGTGPGTGIVKEIVAGTSSSLPQAIQAAGNRAFFFADDGTHGLEPWVTDGTAGGTMLLADIAPGIEDSSDAWASPLFSAVHQGEYYFGAMDDAYATAGDLWKSDGTPSGTVKVKEMGAAIDGYVMTVSSAGGLVHFAFNELGTGGTGMEPWRSDGTAAGTFFLKDINPGTGGSNAGGWVGSGRYAYFRAQTPPDTRLWRSDGTPDGTVLATGAPGDPVVGSIGRIVQNAGKVFFNGSETTVGSELFVLIDQLFVDDFESGDLTAWSAHHP